MTEKSQNVDFWVFTSEMSEWKWRFVNSCKYKSLTSTVLELLNTNNLSVD
jgi:hypothetical protein